MAASLGPDGFKKLEIIGKYAMQSLWSDIDELQRTAHSPITFNDEPGLLVAEFYPERGSGTFNTYLIEEAPESDPEGGFIVTNTIKYRGDLKFQSHTTGQWTYMAAGSTATGTMKIRVLADGTARYLELPTYTSDLAIDFDKTEDNRI